MASSGSGPARDQFALGLAPGAANSSAALSTRPPSPAPSPVAGHLEAVPGTTAAPTPIIPTSRVARTLTASSEEDSSESTVSTPSASTMLAPVPVSPHTYSNAPPPFLSPPSFPSTRSSTPLPTPPLTRSSTTTMGKEKEKSHIDIVLDAPHLTLTGIGPDAEPTILSGHVLLHLSEATDIKEITLQFRGKARIPVPTTDSIINTSAQTYTFCNHDWSFLEGDKRHTRTLKAGRHVFPFSLTILGSLPSSLISHPLNLSGLASTRACISYKLRAVASRPGLTLGHGVHMLPSMHNLVQTTPVHIVRKLPDEALEYQQTLEIENTWPDKLMYAILLPHKAWAAGDTLVGVLKLSPLAKGVRVESVVTALWEQTKVCTRGGVQDDKRIVKAVKHEIIDGKAVEVDMSSKGKNRSSVSGSSTNTRSGFGLGLLNRSSSSSLSDNTDEEDDGFENNDVVTLIKFQIPQTTDFPHHSSSNYPPTVSSSSTSPPGYSSASGSSIHPSTSQSSNTSSFTQVLQPTITPSHSIDPVTIIHRIRWSIYIRNRDGHTSELRCSLPVHIMDGKLLEESRSCSVRTRRMVLQSLGFGNAGTSADGADGYEEGDVLSPDSEVEDRELPSYTAHVRDRVANMYMPEAVTVRVPWAGIVSEGEATNGGDPSPGLDNVDDPLQSPGSASRDELHPLDPRHGPSGSAVSSAAELEYVNAELARARDRASRTRPHSPERRQRRTSTTDSGAHQGSSSGGHHGKPFASFLKAFSSLSHHGHDKHNQHHSSHSHISRSLSSGAVHDELDPQSFSPSPILSRPPSPGAGNSSTPSSSSASTLGSSSNSASASNPSIPTSAAMIHRALIEVPDYAIASRGFMGGVPPLSSMHGLPSYEESSRTHHAHSLPSTPLSELVQEPESISVSTSPDVSTSPGPSRRSSLQRGSTLRSSRSPSRERRETLSDSDLVTRFTRAGVTVDRNESIMQRLGSDPDDGADDVDDDGIQVRIAASVRS